MHKCMMIKGKREKGRKAGIGRQKTNIEIMTGILLRSLILDHSRTNLWIWNRDVSRDYLSNWVSGFTFLVGKWEILDGELWAIFHGVRLALEKGFLDLIVETDSRETVRLLHYADDRHWLSNLRVAIKDLSHSFFSITFNRIYKEQNFVADYLAKQCLSGDFDCMYHLNHLILFYLILKRIKTV